MRRLHPLDVDPVPASASAAANWLLTATNQKKKDHRMRLIAWYPQIAAHEARAAAHESGLQQGRSLGYKDGYAEALGDVTRGGVFTESLVRGCATIGHDLRICPPSEPFRYQ